MARPVNRMRPIHPGEVLREDYLAQLGLSVNVLSVALGVPATRIHEIVKERRTVTAVTADTAARLAKHFGGDATSWLVMQANYDLKTLPALQDIERVDRQCRVVQVAHQRGPAVQAVVDRPGCGATIRDPGALRDEPIVQRHGNRCCARSSLMQAPIRWQCFDLALDAVQRKRPATTR